MCIRHEEVLCVSTMSQALFELAQTGAICQNPTNGRWGIGTSGRPFSVIVLGPQGKSVDNYGKFIRQLGCNGWVITCSSEDEDDFTDTVVLNTEKIPATAASHWKYIYIFVKV